MRVSDDDTPHRRVEVHPGCEVVVEFDPSLTFECVDSCTWCCHHGVLLYDRDLVGLAERADIAEATTRVRGRDFVRKAEKDHDNVGDDGMACRFLDADGLCSLHAEHDWKPTRCSVFPLGIRVEDGELYVDVRDAAREHCDGLGETDRRLIDNLDAFLPKGLWELDDPATRREL
ncbi:YkgJ family cysteine cluster protein [Halovivax sp.]|uniref:YkgJ family cysteine cluster protein n=1 Tax=Halovivax sp. TaxID=1935978 RepID=UPI0025C30FF6|nr:YkgJ family cysteine cluster protein [Halovivax sp.]